MKILAIGSHPDDIELFMFGLLNLYHEKGEQIFLAIVTDGRAGGNDQKNLVEIRRKETINALSLLGMPYFFDFEDGKLFENQICLKTIGDYIKNINPDLIITHSPTDYHPDHRYISEYITNFCSFNFPLIYSENLMGINFYPDYYVDISSYFESKKKAILNHKSQNPKRLLEFITFMNTFRALQCNLKTSQYVECFKLNKNFPYNDISYLIPNIVKPNSFKLV